MVIPVRVRVGDKERVMGEADGLHIGGGSLLFFYFH